MHLFSPLPLSLDSRLLPRWRRRPTSQPLQLSPISLHFLLVSLSSCSILPPWLLLELRPRPSHLLVCLQSPASANICSIAATTNYHKLSSLTQHRCILSVLQIGRLKWVLGLKPRCGRGWFLPRLQGRICFLALSCIPLVVALHHITFLPSASSVTSLL